MSNSAKSQDAVADVSMTRDARQAFERATLSRRGFLKASGALTVGFCCFTAASNLDPVLAQFGVGETGGSPAPNQVDSWISVASDGKVTGYTGKQELGQGIVTAQTQLVAEELCVPFADVTMIAADTARTPDEGYTSGSQSHPTNFNHANLAQAAATARQALIQLASQHLGVPAAQLTARDGAVVVTSNPARKVAYGELVGGKKFSLTLDPNAPRKPFSEWTVLGKPIPRVDIPALAFGTFEFVHNVKVPGMLHGKVVRPPTVGATVLSIDESSVAGMPGLVTVVVKKNFVGVVAEKPWQAIQAANKLKVNWSAGSGLTKQSEYYDHLRKQSPSRDAFLINSGDVDQTLASAATILKATYFHPFQMHGSMGSSCAVADVSNGKATIWSATQGVWQQRGSAAILLGMNPEDVHVIFTRGAGCYGHNGADTVSYDAALLSQAVGKPVRVQLSRKDEMAWENYGYAYVLDCRAGLDAKGNIVAWDHETWSPVLGSRPGAERPGNVITGFLAGFEPQPFRAQNPPSQPRGFNNGSNAIPSYVAGCVEDRCGGAGSIRSERVLTHNVVSPFWTGPLRSPARLQNTFAHESFMDEIAAHIKADPVALRLKYLSNQRVAAVLQAAAKAANWDARPSPKSQHASGVVTGRGVSCVAYEGANGYSAMVIEAEVNMSMGFVNVKRIVVAVDCGPISNPDGLKNQSEGGALQGVSRALGEEVTWDEQKVTSVDWRTYHSLPLGFAIPQIDVVLVNNPGERADGAGELAITLSGSALGNAIFDATGVRICEIPFTPARLKAAFQSAASAARA
ncbi:MAG TPA: molybdopterin cofactor-binding domain-containing protein [Candidatus Acidoferrales bacterium]|nr:molybdopterin cofactor-binding domain-containing protein [Candidatus Acidoferrales bacterium]